MSTDPLADALSEATIQQPVRSPELAEAWGPNLTVDVLQGEPDDETAQRIAAWLRSPEGREVVARELGLAKAEDTLREAAQRHWPHDVVGYRVLLAEADRLAAEGTETAT